MNDTIHIQDKKPNQALCGQTKVLVKYSPLESNCEKCVSYFKKTYPEAWEGWQEQIKEKGEPK